MTLQDSKALIKSMLGLLSSPWLPSPSLLFWAFTVPEQRENRASLPSLKVKMPPDSVGCSTVGFGLDGEAVGSCQMLSLPPPPLQRLQSPRPLVQPISHCTVMVQWAKTVLCINPVATGWGSLAQNKRGVALR